MSAENRVYSYLPETEEHKKMLKNLAIYPDGILHKKAENFTEEELKDKDLIKNMSDTMFAVMNYFGGIGLAAEQANFLKRMLIIDINDENEFFCIDTKTNEKVKPYKMIVINPEILEKSKEETSLKEGCLSLPDIRVNVTRSKTITVKFLDENLNEKIYFMDNLLSKCMQHEIDHLDGILIVDKIPMATKRLIINPKLQKLSKMRR